MNKNNLAVAIYEKIANTYTKQYFDDLTDTPYIDIFLSKLSKGARILDVGSGPGQFSLYMLNKGFQVTGIDFSKEMVKIAKRKVPICNFQQMDMRKLTFKDNNFDGLLVAYSLIHIPTDEIPNTLKGFYRVLKTQGYIQLITQKGEPDQLVNEPFMPTEKMFFNFFTKERLANLLNEAGFAIDYQHEALSQDPESMSDKVIYTIAKRKS